MGFVKRIFLFLAINALVILTVSLLLNLFHVQPFLQEHGVDYGSLLIFCLIWGFAGSFISLALSRKMAKWMMGVQVIDPHTVDSQSKQLLSTVYGLAKSAGLSTMPEVGIYKSNEINAFATGPSKKRSLVAVSSGLLSRMSQEELEGVLGHEVAHIANGDMVTMTLVQGIINAFVMFLARALALALSGLGKQNNRGRSSSGSYGTYRILVFVFELAFMALGMLVIAGYSRYREFRADRGGAQIAGKDKMIAALQALKKTQEILDPAAEKPAFASMKISGSKPSTFRHLFSTHPPLEVRITRLRDLAHF